MSSAGEQFRKTLLKKDRLELVKILKGKNQPTNGGKAELVDRILAYDEKSGGKLSRAAMTEEQAAPPDDEENEEEAANQEPATPTTPPTKSKPKPKPKPKPKAKSTDDAGENDEGGGGGGGGAPININCGDCGGCQPSCNYGTGLAFFAQICTAMAALGQLVLGIIQFSLMVELLDSQCVDEVLGIDTGVDCVGDALVWDTPGADETSSALNAGW
eukprot:CAMPEP_0202695690 /NCGR_PEP_ID=MMETSP1385-20130828/9232_1 /ASSEMBLY_ACC=CAM_ASM_000861 /TAXON_ID=933848 /ORGANISM="Elphidium margaritaceum" /LENGTH=214 /DNA_ID=CAMNT_0049351763 /DNA_START=46 /DNA_END=687 /DNA_ORIENTATION=-